MRRRTLNGAAAYGFPEPWAASVIDSAMSAPVIPLPSRQEESAIEAADRLIARVRRIIAEQLPPESGRSSEGTYLAIIEALDVGQPVVERVRAEADRLREWRDEPPAGPVEPFVRIL